MTSSTWSQRGGSEEHSQGPPETAATEVAVLLVVTEALVQWGSWGPGCANPSHTEVPSFRPSWGRPGALSPTAMTAQFGLPL